MYAATWASVRSGVLLSDRGVVEYRAQLLDRGPADVGGDPVGVEQPQALGRRAVGAEGGLDQHVAVEDDPEPVRLRGHLRGFRSARA